MEQTLLSLKPGVTLRTEGGAVGLALGDEARFASGQYQAVLVRALASHAQTLEELAALLAAQCQAAEEPDAALGIAEFILDFGDYLEA